MLVAIFTKRHFLRNKSRKCIFFHSVVLYRYGRKVITLQHSYSICRWRPLQRGVILTSKSNFSRQKNSQTPIFIQILTLLQKLFRKNLNKKEISTPCISETKYFRTYIYTNFFTYFYLQNMLSKFPEYSSDHPV